MSRCWWAHPAEAYRAPSQQDLRQLHPHLPASAKVCMGLSISSLLKPSPVNVLSTSHPVMPTPTAGIALSDGGRRSMSACKQGSQSRSTRLMICRLHPFQLSDPGLLKSFPVFFDHGRLLVNRICWAGIHGLPLGIMMLPSPGSFHLFSSEAGLIFRTVPSRPGRSCHGINNKQTSSKRYSPPKWTERFSDRIHRTAAKNTQLPAIAEGYGLDQMLTEIWH
jgi:hypothetical protein